MVSLCMGETICTKRLINRLYTFSAKIVVHLHQGQAGRPAGPSSSSPHNFIRLSFRESGEDEVSEERPTYSP